MIAADQFDLASGSAGGSVYGCVTTGEVWQFLKLAGSTALIDGRRFYLDDVAAILAAFQAILKSVQSAGHAPAI